MELDKRKYKRKQVELMIEAYRAHYEKLIEEKNQKVQELLKENSELQTELNSFKEKERLVYLTLERAEKSAVEIKELAQAEYSLEIERIKRFSQKLDKYFEQLEQRYPYYPTTKKAVAINKKIKSANSENAKEELDDIEKMLPNDNEVEFNPKSKIADYIVATDGSGFNMDEVLKPCELNLEDLCKELGLMDEKE